jgi:hypothetical protein
MHGMQVQAFEALRAMASDASVRREMTMQGCVSEVRGNVHNSQAIKQSTVIFAYATFQPRYLQVHK